MPIRYGDYIARLSLTPISPELKALKDEKIELDDYDGLRPVVTDFFRSHPAEFEIRIQLCTDLERMPVENANKEWPEDESPYQPLARLTFSSPGRLQRGQTGVCRRPSFFVQRTVLRLTARSVPSCERACRRMKRWVKHAANKMGML